MNLLHRVILTFLLTALKHAVIATAASPRGWEAADAEERQWKSRSAEPSPPEMLTSCAIQAEASLPVWPSLWIPLGFSFALGLIVGMAMYHITARLRKLPSTRTLHHPPPHTAFPSTSSVSGVTTTTNSLSNDNTQQDKDDDVHPKAIGYLSNECTQTTAPTTADGPEPPRDSNEFAQNNCTTPSKPVDQRLSNDLNEATSPATPPLSITAATPENTDRDAAKLVNAPLAETSFSAITSATISSEMQQHVTAAKLLLVESMSTLSVDPSELTPDGKVQLLKAGLQAMHVVVSHHHSMAMQDIGGEANDLRNKAVHIADDAEKHRQAKAAHSLAKERTEEFRKLCSDTLWTGLAVMSVFATWQLMQRGGFVALVPRCGGFPSFARRRGGVLSLYGTVARLLEVSLCYAGGVWDCLLGIAMLAAAPWVLFKTGLLSGDHHSLPVFKLFVGLGVICGTAGYVAMNRLGGNGTVWVVLWLIWTVGHIGLSSLAHTICLREVSRHVSGDQQQGRIDPGAMYFDRRQGSWVIPTMWIVLGVCWPVLTAILPFRFKFS